VRILVIRCNEERRRELKKVDWENDMLGTSVSSVIRQIATKTRAEPTIAVGKTISFFAIKTRSDHFRQVSQIPNNVNTSSFGNRYVRITFVGLKYALTADKQITREG
jgi:hypothetical protein